MTPVKSSQIEAIGYSAPKLLLTVRFRGGSTYEYKNVKPSQHTALMAAESKGTALRPIKDNPTRHPFRKLN